MSVTTATKDVSKIEEKDNNKDNDDMKKEEESELQRVIDDMTGECQMRQNHIEELEEELEEKAAKIDELIQQIESLEKSQRNSHEEDASQGESW